MAERNDARMSESAGFLGLLEDSSSEDSWAARLLLSDFVASIRGHRVSNAGFESPPTGAAETAMSLASAASDRDLDDVDWSGPHHPGSVIWAAVIASAATTAGVSGSRLVHAGVCGYRVAAAAAGMLGREHSRRWHVTATAGALGAAAAVSVVRSDDLESTSRALSFSMLNLGGLGQAALERRGAARATRAYAAAQGVLSVALAHSDVPSVQLPWSGSRGVEHVLLADRLSDPIESSPWPTVGLRLYPVNGFIHSAVRVTADISAEVDADFTEIVWELPQATVAMVDSADHGLWWDARLAAVRAMGSGSPWEIDQAGPWDRLVDRVRLEYSELPIGSSRVHVVTSSMVASRDAPRINITAGGEFLELAHTKWTRVLGIEPDEVSAIVDEMVGEAPDWQKILVGLSR